MDGKFPEQFKCPICFEIPQKEIFQCKNGHTLCDICVESLELCPQCRVSLGPSRIRSRPLEELLDMMKFDCSYKPEGCQIKVTRKDMTSHAETCSFGGVPLCKYLGYACCHRINTSNLQESVQHLEQEHQSLSTNSPKIAIVLKTLKNVDKNGRCLWNPILVNSLSNKYLLVICSFQSNILFSCISLGGGSETVKIKFNIKPKNDKFPALEWTTKPYSLTDSKTMLQSPPFQFSLNLLVEQYLQREDFTLQVYLTNDNFTSREAAMILYSFAVLKSHHQLDSSTQSATQSEFGFGSIVHAIQAKYNGSIFVSSAYCNVCRVNPLVGLRFKCLQCADYDLCIECFEKKEHSFHHFTVLCTNTQEISYRNKCRKSGVWKPFVDVPEISCRGDLFGSTLSDAKELHCQKCRNQPDFMCLQCTGPFGLCKMCFVNEMHSHDALHYFAFTPTDSAREFVVYVLRKHNILPRLRHEYVN